MVCADEADTLKNPHSLATMLMVACATLHAPRMIPITGTGYNNHLQDMATLMSLIDPRLEQATLRWWQDTMQHPSKVLERLGKEGKAHNQTVQTVEATQRKNQRGWHTNFLVRRTKEECNISLPEKMYVSHVVEYLPLHLGLSIVVQLAVQNCRVSCRGERCFAKVRAQLVASPGDAQEKTLKDLGELPRLRDAPSAAELPSLQIGLCDPERHALRLIMTTEVGGRQIVKDIRVAELHAKAMRMQAEPLLGIASECRAESAAASGSAAEAAAAAAADGEEAQWFNEAAETLSVGGVEVEAVLACRVLEGSYLAQESEYLRVLPLFVDAHTRATQPGGSVIQRQAARAKVSTRASNRQPFAQSTSVRVHTSAVAAGEAVLHRANGTHAAARVAPSVAPHPLTRSAACSSVLSQTAVLRLPLVLSGRHDKLQDGACASDARRQGQRDHLALLPAAPNDSEHEGVWPHERRTPRRPAL
jgi:hypothetical protein